ncbi:virulence protein SciE type [Ramlibacter sp. AW1]|uniref:Virulence protein SciE type n=1 Tax=Ramlibacter aurantiacus TaxID=2801330 RepID=A0A937D2C6_9BURK|nr:type VI secretion system accessory protein TagJ [Ramlibacter aurantiacus]MBL0419615.1 virulence protein SciE type [Ramlibacter aurantiacus]
MSTDTDIAADALQAIRAGELRRALELLQEHVRRQPSDARLRTFLFQLLAVRGEWDRALRQLGMAGELDPSAQPMVQTYEGAIRCEPLREQVFAGKKVPLLLGEPEPWTALLLEALLQEGQGDSAAGAGLRARALDEAPVSAGTANGEAFEWLADADTRIGPVLEAVMQGRYYWVPFTRIARISLDPPVDLRDVVWMPAHLQFSNGGESVALLPTRYAGTPLDQDAFALSRRTDWAEPEPGRFVGQGQRILATPSTEYPLMDLREVVFDLPAAGPDDEHAQD